MMIEIGNIDFNEFLRFQSCIMILLLVVQALDYVFGFGVNLYAFVVFCIVFAFTLGSVYYNIIITTNSEKYDKKLKTMEDIMACNCEEIHSQLDSLEERISFLSDDGK